MELILLLYHMFHFSQQTTTTIPPHALHTRTSIAAYLRSLAAELSAAEVPLMTETDILPPLPSDVSQRGIAQQFSGYGFSNVNFPVIFPNRSQQQQIVQIGSHK